jgi:hypothetical protein
MSPDSHPAIQRESCRAFHDVIVPGVTAAGDVRAGDVLHQRRFVGGVFQFAHIAVDIERHDLSPHH